MDDYILELLQMQGEPEADVGDQWKLEQTLGAVTNRENATFSPEKTAQRNLGYTAEKNTKQSYDQREEMQRLLRGMESVNALPVTVLAGYNAGAQQMGQSKLVAAPEREIAQVGISPEALSMFFQRDARRYS